MRMICVKFKKAQYSFSQMGDSATRFRQLLPDDVSDVAQLQSARFFIDSRNRYHIKKTLEDSCAFEARNIIQDADDICAHIFSLLASGRVHLGESIPWHTDFKTGYTWKPKFYLEMMPIDPINDPQKRILKYDGKVPLELSRFQHVTTLGAAYWYTENEKYATEFVDQITDWIDKNPSKVGVNWAITMDVSIRVANWIWGYYFFKESEALTDDFLIKFLKSLLAHGRHIMANLENRGITSNHYLSDLVGLIYLGITFPEFKEANRWREFGIKELVKEMGKQVYNDGMDFEASTCYHRLALELFFYPALLCRLNGIELPKAFAEKLKKMFDFVLYVLKPNGRMPQIGDNDNGRLHVLGKRDILDMTYLLTFATLFFGDPEYKIKEFGFAPEALWLFGPEAYECWKKMPGRSVEELESRAFPDGGIYVMRHKNDYMVISCGPNGQGGIGGHAHNDKLSFELCVDGEDIIVDPGTYVYTANPKWRDKFRSTAYHNTVIVDGEEQNGFDRDNLFKLRDEADARCEKWVTTEEYDLFVGQHSGYRKLPAPIAHRREIQFDKKSKRWNVRDMLFSPLGANSGDKYHSYCSHLHLSPAVYIEQDKKGMIIRWQGTSGCALRVESESAVSKQDDSWYSPSYGTKLSSKWLTRCEEGFAPYNAELILKAVREGTKQVLDTSGHGKQGFKERI